MQINNEDINLAIVGSKHTNALAQNSVISYFITILSNDRRKNLYHHRSNIKSQVKLIMVQYNSVFISQLRYASILLRIPCGKYQDIRNHTEETIKLEYLGGLDVTLIYTFAVFNLTLLVWTNLLVFFYDYNSVSFNLSNLTYAILPNFFVFILWVK